VRLADDNTIDAAGVGDMAIKKGGKKVVVIGSGM